jgi:hypothetical protein
VFALEKLENQRSAAFIQEARPLRHRRLQPLAPFLLPLSQANTGATAVLVYEFYSSGFNGTPQFPSRVIRDSGAKASFQPLDGRKRKSRAHGEF